MKPIFWHQGLFLQPQHFQLNDQYHQASLRPYLQHMHPHFWGVADLDLVTSAVTHKTCEIEKGKFLFPDGTYVDLESNGIIKQRSFEEAWAEPDKPFTIYVGLKKNSIHGENVTVVNSLAQMGEVNTRYVTCADPEQISDIYKPGPEANVKFLVHVLRFVWESEIESLEDYQLIPVARVVRTETGVGLDKNFQPPLLSIGSSDELKHLIKEIRDDLTGRSVQLAGYDLEGEESKKYDATLMRYKLAARTLSRYIPRLFHFTETGDVHPWDVYGLLRELIGEVSTFTKSVNVLGENFDGERLLPGYDHRDIGMCFASAKYLLAKMLNEITVGPQYLVEMPRRERYFHADIPQEFFDKKVDFYLIISTQSDFEVHQNSLLTTGKLASSDMVERLAERSLPGVGLIHVSVPPADMPRRPDAHYVRVDIHDEQWATIERHRDIALLWDEAPEDAKVELVIVRR